MEERLDTAVGLISSVAERIAAEFGNTSARELGASAGRILAVEAPLAPVTLIEDIVNRVVGFGPLQRLIDDGDVTDILVNGPDEVWLDRGNGLERSDATFESAGDLMATVERSLAGLGLRLDRMSPTVEGRLPDGSRIHVAIPPATVDHPVIAVRRFTARARTMTQLVETGTVSKEGAELLEGAVVGRRNIIVSGGTGSGKTTLLNVMAGLIPPEERIVTVEDAAELRFPGHVVRLEARPSNAEGLGEIQIRSLLRSALRLRPDRIVLGEVRGGEALDLITALNTGHSGSMSTVHANSPEEAIWRLETLALLDGAASPDAIRRQLLASVDIVIQLERDRSERRVTDVSAVGRDGALERLYG